MFSSILLFGFGGLAIAFVAYFITKVVTNSGNPGKFPHPSELSSSSRSMLRPLRQAAENFEEVLKANPNLDAAQILGPNALDSVRRTLIEATKMMPNRDVLVEMARRTESQGNDPSAPHDAIDRIDRNIAEATAAIDALTLRITQSSSQSTQAISDVESELPDLVKRLQNVSQSFDEVNQSVSQDN